jgi:hypothetical protein
MKRLFVFWILIAATLIHACMPTLPQSAKDLAISTLCDFPAYSGENMCKRVEIYQVAFPKTVAGQTDKNLKLWCIELKYVDYTGESGFASMELIGPTDHGEFQLKKGPVFGENCAGLN